ncbi:MAG: WGxxGxxG-CTERM domain-containing protein [Cyanosarcina radialis HA8281-LM2]|jgi:hypothetical protein|nr:WGxxGxxG-CTERM domain-containing protein [Cyanosarcina radialis HA8281-LM2]
MKKSNWSKLVATGVLAGSLILVPLTLPASAQTGTGQDPTSTPVQDTAVNRDDNDFNWGWLGLLGLIGLAGLARKREEPTRYRDPNEVSSSSYRQ